MSNDKTMSDKKAADALFQATALIGLGVVLVVAAGTGVWMCCMMFFR
jgi:hypothetical protein